jgi:dTDP-4-dehydrorhamnose reductase
MNILLFGKTGQVGWELQRALAPLGNLIAVDVHSKSIAGTLAILKGSLKPFVQLNQTSLLMRRRIQQ